MRIGLVLTGGTLDSASTAQGLDARIESGFGNALRAVLKVDQSLEEIPSPWRIDSSQLDTFRIHSLGTALLEAPAMDAWIVVAGTDTLAWLAPSLWWMLGSLGVPVLLACGMSPWWVSGEDGETTLNSLPTILEQGMGPGVHVVSNGRGFPPCGLHKISHLVRDPFRPLSHLAKAADLDSLWAHFSQPYPVPPTAPGFPTGMPRRPPSVLWLPSHPGLDPDLTVRSLGSSPPRHLVLGGYSGGTLPLPWLEALSGLPSTLHLVSQQWGPMELESYAVSAGFAQRLLAWNLGPETVTALLALADALELETEEGLAPLRTLQAWTWA